MQHSLTLPSVLTTQTVSAAMDQLRQELFALPAGVTVVLDAGQVTNFDSACLAMLLECRRLAQSKGQVLSIGNWTQSLQSLAHVYGVMQLLDPSAEASEQSEDLA